MRRRYDHYLMVATVALLENPALAGLNEKLKKGSVEILKIADVVLLISIIVAGIMMATMGQAGKERAKSVIFGTIVIYSGKSLIELLKSVAR